MPYSPHLAALLICTQPAQQLCIVADDHHAALELIQCIAQRINGLHTHMHAHKASPAVSATQGCTIRIRYAMYTLRYATLREVSSLMLRLLETIILIEHPIGKHSIDKATNSNP